jgi:hypothetical protein
MSQSEYVYFHVSRDARSIFTEGQVIQANCQEYLGTLSDEERELINHYFGEGLSRHGSSYLGNHRADPSLVRELIWELVRRESFPHHPSRFRCLFAFANPLNAIDFATEYVASRLEVGHEITHDLWMVQPIGAPFVADMNLLKGGRGWLQVLSNAQSYWQGDSSPEPLFETLLPLPVRVVKCAGKVVCRKHIENGHEIYRADFARR